ncbi:serine hydrolase domain-containing protein [Acuticoccus kandeliae]|uniref:serine hydrolase domain-containing protein n=1 Tax=Acuticoccus kandeliae TaxID=2073160 RepID=UPI000D3E6BE9|nr:serine hydrolase domain-containing protein [Acuticoccus kandeliae]
MDIAKIRLVGLAVAACAMLAASAPPARAQTDGETAAAIVAMAEAGMKEHGLRSVIVRVVIDGEEIVTKALGESIGGVPATPQMHFRSGNVAFSYMATITLLLAEEKRLDLDGAIATWLPDLPHADAITPRMLLNMTSGYADYVPDEGFQAAFFADPFRQWTPEELIAIGVAQPLLFEPGTNWGYSHTGYVILGQLIETVTGEPLAETMRARIFGPLGLTNTDAPATAEIRAPALHAFSSERREPLGIDPSVRFYEESTHWNPSWTTAPGAVQTTNIYDMTATAIGIGTGALLSEESYQAMVGPSLVGFGGPTDECPSCRALDESFHYGLGTFLAGSWILQSPFFGGYAAVEGYLPSKKIALALAVTFTEAGFAKTDTYGDAAQRLFIELATYLAPDDHP